MKKMTSIFCVEAGSNISTVALKVTGDKKGTQCLGYNWATLLLGRYKYRYMDFQVGEYRI
jgi:hypothetical protein